MNKRHFTALALILVFLLAGIARPADCVIVVQATTATGSSILFEEDFEAMTDGEEWENDGNWTESASTTGVYVGDIDTPGIPQGSVAGMQTSQATTAGRQIYSTAFATGTSTITASYYFKFAEYPTTEYGIPMLKDLDVGNMTTLSIRDDGYLAAYQGSWTDVVLLVPNKWYFIEIELDRSISSGTDAWFIWIDNVKFGPFDTQYSTPSGTDVIKTDAWQLGSGEIVWYDDIIVEVGARTGPTDFTRDPNILGAWRMNVDGGDTATEWDVSGNDAHLTQTGGTIPRSTDVLSGWDGYSRDITATDTEELYHGDGESTDITAGASAKNSFCAAFKTDTITADASLVNKYSTTGDNRSFKFRYDVSSAAMLAIYSGDGLNITIAEGATDTDDGAWHTACVVSNDVDIRIYVDGTLDSNGGLNPIAHTAGIYNGNSDFIIGAINTAGGSPWDGLIDNVIYLDRAITATEVGNYHTYGMDGLGGASEKYDFTQDHNAQGAWAMVGFSDQGEVDRTGNNQNLIITGAGDRIPQYKDTMPSGYTGLNRDFERSDADGLGIYEVDGTGIDISGANQHLTLCAVVRLEAISASDWQFVQKSAASNAQYRLGYEVSSGSCVGGVDCWEHCISPDGTNWDCAFLGPPSINTWYQQCLTYDDVNIEGWEDGLLVDSKAHTAGIYNGNGPLVIGDGPTDFNPNFDGPINSVIIFDRALKPWEIYALYKEGMAGDQGASDYLYNPSVFREPFSNVDFYDGEEWDNDDKWTEDNATTDMYVADSATGTPRGFLAGMVEANATAAEKQITANFLEIGEGYFTTEFWFKFSGTPTTALTVLYIAGSNPLVNMRIDSGGDLQVYDNTTWTDVDATIASGTWYKVDVEVDSDDSDGIGSVRIWVDGVESANSPFDTHTRADPGGLDIVRSNQYQAESGLFVWVDEINTYLGARGTQADNCTTIDSDDFENTDGVNLFGHSSANGSWIGSNVNAIEFSNNFGQAGGTSVKTDHSNTVSTYSNTLDFTAQTTGVFTISIQFLPTSLTESASSFYPIMLVEDSAGGNLIQIGYYQDDISSYDSSKVTIETAALTTANVFYQMDIEIDTDNRIFNTYLNGVLIDYGRALYTTTDPSKVTLREWAGGGSAFTYFDNLHIYKGAINQDCDFIGR